jgi:GH15 family glucan-1,4-alpha-glucosidase
MSACTYDGDWRDAVVRSLLTLKALTYPPTGGIVAATTSLPEHLGGGCTTGTTSFCWHCCTRNSSKRRRRGGSGCYAPTPEIRPRCIMYAVAGQRRLEEYVVDWLPGHDDRPVRIGNAAARQVPIDVYGEVMDAVHQARRSGLKRDDPSWALQANDP